MPIAQPAEHLHAPSPSPSRWLDRSAWGWLLAGVLALAPPLACFSLGYSALNAELRAPARQNAEQAMRPMDAQAQALGGPPAGLPNDPPGHAPTGPVPPAQVPLSQRLQGLLLGTLAAALAGQLLGFGLLARRGLLRRSDQGVLARLRDEQERARVTLHAIADAVVTTDARQCITYLNPVAERLLQTTLAEAQGQALLQICPLVDEDTLQAVTHPIGALLQAPGPAARPAPKGATPNALPAERQLALLRGDGSSLPIEHRSAPIHDGQGRLIGAVMVFHDVTAVRRMAQRISWTAAHDALTGLVNRRELEARVASALASTANSGTSHVLCCINLDQFKLVNDSFGHSAGDSLLKQVAVQLQSRLREADTLARLDGDAFGVLLEGCGLAAGERIAQGLLETLRTCRFSWEGHHFTLQASVGLAALDAQAGDPAAVFAAADAACSAAKDQGRNRVCAFQGQDAAIAQRRNDMGWAARLNAALDEGRFRLYYQTYLALGSTGTASAPGGAGAVAGAVVGAVDGAAMAPIALDPPSCTHVEILLRLVDEEGRTVSPGDFMPAAERYNVMPAIDRWVIGQVFSRYADLAAQLGTPGLTCGVNLSGTSLNAEGLLEYIQAQARHHRLPAGAVCFEITETAAINDLKRAAQFMTAVKALGCSFALDDFGVGSSSFGYLKHLPVDLLKIDGSFVRDMVQDPVDRAMVDTINRVGHIMGLKTVAEFAENDQIIEGLRRLGVDYAQGYGVHRPQALPEPQPVPQGAQPPQAPARPPALATTLLPAAPAPLAAPLHLA